jgi:hypothetical protein
MEAVVVRDRAGLGRDLVGDPLLFGARVVDARSGRAGPCASGAAAPSAGWSSPAKTESFNASSTAENARVAGSLLWGGDFFAITLHNSRNSLID